MEGLRVVLFYLFYRNNFDIEYERAVWGDDAEVLGAIGESRGDDESQLAAGRLVDDAFFPAADEGHFADAVGERFVGAVAVVDVVFLGNAFDAGVEHSAVEEASGVVDGDIASDFDFGAIALLVDSDVKAVVVGRGFDAFFGDILSKSLFLGFVHLFHVLHVVFAFLVHFLLSNDVGEVDFIVEFHTGAGFVERRELHTECGNRVGLDNEDGFVADVHHKQTFG